MSVRARRAYLRACAWRTFITVTVRWQHKKGKICLTHLDFLFNSDGKNPIGYNLNIFCKVPKSRLPVHSSTKSYITFLMPTCIHRQKGHQKLSFPLLSLTLSHFLSICLSVFLSVSLFHRLTLAVMSDHGDWEKPVTRFVKTTLLKIYCHSRVKNFYSEVLVVWHWWLY